jgi:hypothetical protein
VCIWDYHTGLPLNQNLVINKAKNDFILYVEDKVLIKKIPDFNSIYQLHTKENFSFIFYNCHFNNVYTNSVKEHILNLKNYVKINDNLFLKRDNNIIDEYKILFPVAIFEKNIYNSIYNIASTKNNKLGIEISLSNAFMESEFNKRPTFTYISENILNDLNKFNCFEITNNGNNMADHPIHNYANMDYYPNGYAIKSLVSKYIIKYL